MENKQKTTLPAIKYGKIPNILLLGNGISRAFNQVSWDDLLKGISEKSLNKLEEEQLKKVPYPLQPVILTNDCIDVKVKDIATRLIDIEVLSEQAQLIKGFTDLHFDAILTTNYTYDIEKSIDTDFYCKINKNSKYRKSVSDGSKTENQFGMYKYMEVEDGTYTNRVWHIHGEAARPNSMILGHYYYGKLLSKIQQYISTVKRRYEGCKNYKSDFTPHSWIDYFLLGNVHIVGFGMDFSEMDIWWLINCKKRNAINDSKIYYYEPNMKSEGNYNKNLLAKAYGVEVITEKVNKDYKKYYYDLAETVKKNM